jgi:glycosyltransferase involved in cell wall biosynthesis
MQDHAMSIVIPAHNEEAGIRRCLQNLLPGLGNAEVVVVANGCSDSTADVARSFSGVTVVEVEEASKINALNVGDRMVRAFPRIYLDSDIVMDAHTARELARQIGDDGAIVASPKVRFDVSASSWPVRSFYRTYRELPYVRDGLVGLGVYGLSRQARGRFAAFPDITSDDLYVQRFFAPDERRVSPGYIIVAAPRDVRSLIKVRMRVASGNRELASASPADARFASSTKGTLVALADAACRRPSAALDALTYMFVILAARIGTRLRKRTTWHRDNSTR